MRGRKRHLKKVAKKKELQAAKKSSCKKSCGCKKKASPAKPAAAAPKVGAKRCQPSPATKFSYYGKSKVCHAVTVDAKGVVTALCGDVWTPGDEKDAPTIIDIITDDRRLCKKCEKKQ